MNAHAFQLDNIDDYLKSKEAIYSDIVENTEKVVHWAGEAGQKTEFSIIYIHGFSASRQEVMPLPELVAKAFNANVYYTRLNGHGRSVEAMGEPSMQDWIDDTVEAYEIGQTIGEKVIVIGTSTGGTLLAWLEQQDFADALFASILISPNFDVRDKKAYLLPYSLGMTVAKWINGPYYRFEVQNEIHAKYWTEKYPLEAVVPMVELVNEVYYMERSHITLPHLIIYSDKDEVIDPKAIKRYFSQLGGNQNQLNEVVSQSVCGNHVLAGDACSPETTEEVTQSITSYINSLIESHKQTAAN